MSYLQIRSEILYRSTTNIQIIKETAVFTPSQILIKIGCDSMFTVTVHYAFYCFIKKKKRLLLETYSV